MLAKDTLRKCILATLTAPPNYKSKYMNKVQCFKTPKCMKHKMYTYVPRNNFNNFKVEFHPLSS